MFRRHSASSVSGSSTAKAGRVTHWPSAKARRVLAALLRLEWQVLPSEGETRIPIYLDDVVIDRFKALSKKSGKGYQTLVNVALRA